MNTDSLFGTLPSEMIYQILSHLLPKKLLSIMRVNALWRFLGRNLLNHFLQEESPFLMAQAFTASDSQRVALLKKQQNFCIKLAERHDLPPEYFRTTYIKDFLKAHPSDENFLLPQDIILEAFAVASGFAEERQDCSDKGLAWVLMAQMGNIQKLSAWHEIHGENISCLNKDEALWEAACHGHVACVAYLIETCGQMSEEGKGEALIGAVENGQIGCVRYLIENCEDISMEHKEEALWAAVYDNQVECLLYLAEICDQEILDEYAYVLQKEIAAEMAQKIEENDPPSSHLMEDQGDFFCENFNNALTFTCPPNTNAESVMEIEKQDARTRRKEP